MTQQTISSASILGQTIRAARLNMKLTQAELGKITGVQPKTISAIENGMKGVQLDTLFRLLSGLELTITLNHRRQPSPDEAEW